MGPVDGADLRFRSPQPDRHQLILRDHRRSASRGMSDNFPTEAGSHFIDRGP